MQTVYKYSGCSPGMTQGDGSNTKAQSYCPDQYRHIETTGQLATCLMWYSVKELNRKNSYSRRSQTNSLYLYAAQSRTKEADHNHVCSHPLARHEIPSRHNHFSDMSWEKGSVGNNNTLKHTRWHTQTCSLSEELQNRDHRYTYMHCVKRWQWLNRHTVFEITGSFDAFPVLYGSLGAYRGTKNPQKTDATTDRERVHGEEWHRRSMLASWK